ncbi:MAG: PAS domain S-box protein [Actinomycetota bacterium]
MMEFLNNILLNQNFIPHGHCYLWQPQLVGLHLLSDLLIALSYYSIPALLIYFVNKREDLPFSWIFLLFGAFIISCGTTHLMAVWTLWHPTYWLSGIIKAITAIVSCYTALELVPLMPKALALPSPAQLEAANQALLLQIIERERAEAALQTVNEELESRVAARTAELQQINAQLLTEITERQRIEDTLRETVETLNTTSARFRRVLESNMIGMGFWDIHGHISEANDALLKFLGYTRAELEAGLLNWRAMTPPEYAEISKRALQEISEFGYCTPFEKEYICKDGSRVPALMGAAMFEDSLESGVFFVLDLTERKAAERALRESEERFRVAQELSLDGFTVLRSVRNSQGDIQDFSWEYVNPTAGRLLQSQPEALIGKQLLQVLPGNKNSGLFDRYVKVVETGIPHDVEIAYHSEGINGWFRNMAVKLGDGIAISFSDISGRKQVEQSLREALQRLTSHFENTPLAVVEWDREFRCTVWSPAAEKIFGWRATEVLGLQPTQWSFVCSDDAIAVTELLNYLRNGTQQRNISHNRNYKKDGTIVHCEWYNSALYDESGSLVSVLSLVLDVTERYRFLEVLRQSEERFRIAAESASDLIYEWDINSDILLWFGHVDEHLGQQSGAFPRTRAAWNQIIHPEDRDRVLSAVEQYLSNQSTSPFLQEYRVLRQDGSWLYWIDRGTVVMDAQGRPSKLIGAIGDITARTKAEEGRNQALAREQIARMLAQANESYLRTLAEAIPQIVWSALANGTVDYFNQRWFDYTGMQPQQSLGWQWQAAIHPDDLQKTLDRWSQAVQTGGSYEVAYRLKRAADGQYRWHLGRGLPVRDTTGQIVKWFGTCTDINDQKRAEEGAHFLAEASTVLASSLDYESTLQRLTNLAVPTLADWCCVHLAEADGSIRLVAVAHPDPGKLELIWAIEQCQPLDPQGRHGVARVLRTGEAKVYAEIPDSVLEATAPDVASLMALREWGMVSAMCVPLKARDRILGVLSMLSAESGRRYGREDLELAEQLAYRAAIAIDNAWLYWEAQEANRLKDEFLATLSHELRTPINAILGWSQILQQRKLTPEKTALALETIERNARAQTQMIEDLLDVSRVIGGKFRLNFRAVEIVSVVEAALDTVRPAAEVKGIELVTVLDQLVGSVLGDMNRLQQVVWNLLSNAVKFTPTGGRVEVRVQTRRGELPGKGHPETASASDRLIPTGEAVEIQVSDTGIGISPKFLPHVFERFRQADSTSTRFYGGLGLGLAIVRHLVELHGGSVRAESLGEGKGATFTVRLPLWKQSGERVQESARGKALPTAIAVPDSILQGLQVLVVDDEADTRDLLMTVLRQCGAHCTAVASARETLEVLAHFQPDVLVSDIGMPGEDGYALIRQVRKLTPERGGNIPAVALTAYAREKDRQQAMEAGFSVYVRKPVEPAELVAVVAQLAKQKEHS